LYTRLNLSTSASPTGDTVEDNLLNTAAHEAIDTCATAVTA
jgi:hypothetical protein